jgi:hypothetical protein
MSRYFFQRLTQGYLGTKKKPSKAICRLPYCNQSASQYKGPGSQLCENHQKQMREYGGPGRLDRPWTFHKKATCDKCGHNPWEHPLVKKIEDDLIRDRVAWGMLFVDHIHTQRDGGDHSEQNVQTLCLDCNVIKSTLAGDLVPKKLYSNEQDYQNILDKLKPHYEKVFEESV